MVVGGEMVGGGMVGGRRWWKGLGGLEVVGGGERSWEVVVGRMWCNACNR